MNHLPIRVSTLRGDQQIDFDAYVKINEKFVLYLRKGDSFEGQRLLRLKEKKLKKMFILEHDETQYRSYLNRNIEMAYNDSSKSLETRSEIIQGAQQSHAEEVMENPENEAAYNEAKSACNQFVEFLNKEQLAVDQILRIENVDASVAHHGVTVSTLAVTLAKKLGDFDAKQIQLLSLGALLHDFEHFHSGITLKRPIKQFSADEKMIYESHPMAGGKRVQDKKHFDQTVINIITQHEECVDGSGFPQKLIESKTDPLAVVTSSCNALDRLVTFEGFQRKDAAKQLIIGSVGKHPLKQIQLLGEIVK
jgi:putative nucleotidyltransferase with HDIG domain